MQTRKREFDFTLDGLLDTDDKQIQYYKNLVKEIYKHRSLSRRGEENQLKELWEELFQCFEPKIELISTYGAWNFNACTLNTVVKEISTALLDEFPRRRKRGFDLQIFVLSVTIRKCLDAWKERFQNWASSQPKRGEGAGTINERIWKKLRNVWERKQNQVLNQPIDNDRIWKIIMEKLNDVQRNIMILRYLIGMPEKDIATVLGISYDNTRVILYRAWDKIYKRYQNLEL